MYVNLWACSSVGRALRSQRRGRGFDPLQVHHAKRARAAHVDARKLAYFVQKADYIFAR